MTAAEARAPSARGVMFIQDFQVVSRPYEEVIARVGAGTELLLGAALDSAREEGARLWRKVGPTNLPAALSRTVEIHPGPIRVHGASVLVAFSWETRGSSSLLPALDADLEIAPFGSGQTRVTLQGRYKPPLGWLGWRADQLLLHRVAESTARAFLTEVCKGLESASGGSSTDPAHA